MASIFYNNMEYGSGGHEVYYGTSVPSSSQGISGDMYCRLDGNGNLVEEYIKLGSNWTLVPKSDAVLGSKNITANGNYIAQSENLDGYSNISVNVPTGGSTLITKTITQNGTYDAEDDDADGYSSVTVNVSGGGGGTFERLCLCSENSSSARHSDHTHIAYFDDGIGTITEDTNYSNYLSYDNTTRKFTVLQDFGAIFVAWTYNYQSASGSYSQGEFYINDTEVSEWEVGQSRSYGYFRGLPIIQQMHQGDTFYSYTPSSNGYPEQNLKIYRADSSYMNAFANEMDIFGITSYVSGFYERD